MHTPSARSTDTLVPGLSLIAAGALAALVMLVHPTAHGVDMAGRLCSLSEISSLSRHVHLAMILCVVVLWLSLASLARRRPASGWVAAAVHLYALGAVALLGAALVSGLLLAAYLHRPLPHMARAEDALAPVLLAFSANQLLAGAGTLLMSAGLALWSVPMLRDRSRPARTCGGYGILAGLLCGLGYAIGRIPLDVPGMTLVVVAHGLWYCLLGAWALRSATRPHV